jgi:FkbM family methyltransferase
VEHGEAAFHEKQTHLSAFSLARRVLVSPYRLVRRLLEYRVIDQNEIHTIWEQRHLRRFLRHYDVDCVFDVGANYGQYAQMLRRAGRYKGWIVSFEPNPAAAAALRGEAERDPKWIVEEVAVGSRDGIETFNIMKSSQFSSLSAPRHDEVEIFRELNTVVDSVSVKTEALDSAFARLRQRLGFRRPFLKLDTQGYDTAIVANAGAALTEFVGLQSELAVKKLYRDSQDFRDALTLYEARGFTLSALVPNNAGHFPRLVEIDCIMVRTDLLTTGGSD